MKIGNLGKVLCVSALSATMANAQDINVYKALNYSLEDPTLGSARYAGMGGAMGAIGGVTSALQDNAANIAAGTASDIGLTFDVYSNNDGQCSFAISDASLMFNIDHNSKSGYMSSAFAVSYNRNRTFDSDMYKQRAYIDSDNPYLSKTTDSERGGTDAINFAYAGNINNQFYFGVAVGITNLRYEKRNIYDDYNLTNSADYIYEDYLGEGSGVGCNFNVGLLYQPTDFMRVGVGFQTPTLYTIEDKWSFLYGGPDPVECVYKYKLHTPMKFSAQLGFMIGDRANIGVDYSLRNYSRMYAEYDNVKLRELEQDVKDICKTQHTFKIGAEVNVVGGLDVRAGYSICTAPVIGVKEACDKFEMAGGAYSIDFNNPYVDNDGIQVIPRYSLFSPMMRQYISAGFGYSGRAFYVDFAYIRKISSEEFMTNLPYTGNPYLDNDQCDIVSQYIEKNTFGSNHFMLSLGFHF